MAGASGSPTSPKPGTTLHPRQLNTHEAAGLDKSSFTNTFVLPFRSTATQTVHHESSFALLTFMVAATKTSRRAWHGRDVSITIPVVSRRG